MTTLPSTPRGATRAGVVADGFFKMALGLVYLVACVPLASALGVPVWLAILAGITVALVGMTEARLASHRTTRSLLVSLALYDGLWVLVTIAALLLASGDSSLGGVLWLGYQIIAAVILTATLVSGVGRADSIHRSVEAKSAGRTLSQNKLCNDAGSMATTDTPDDANAVVEVHNLRKTYGPFVALDGVSFAIHRGETFALLGPNGAGKSTTIEILEGYRQRTSGEARVLGVDPGIGGLPWRAQLGIVLQSTGETGNVTVRELLTQFAGYYPAPRDVDEVIASVGLREKDKTRIGKLSGGQRRRVDVALGIIGNPALLFLDEPTTGFDPEARRQFWGLIRSLKASGTSILLTTHYLDEAAQLGDRAAVIAGGRLIDIGKIDEIGGAASRMPVVRWTDATGRRREERTPEPGRAVAALVAEAGGEPRDIEIARPTLEDVYLSLIGADSDDAYDSEPVEKVRA